CLCRCGLYCSCIYSFFFFSRRRRHTRFSRDWSSDVCSSDLAPPELSTSAGQERSICERRGLSVWPWGGRALSGDAKATSGRGRRSEERRVGKECRSGWAPED